jgi:hypothetical protein
VTNEEMREISEKQMAYRPTWEPSAVAMGAFHAPDAHLHRPAGCVAVLVMPDPAVCLEVFRLLAPLSSEQRELVMDVVETNLRLYRGVQL